MRVEFMMAGFDGWMATPGAHTRQSEQCILVRTAARCTEGPDEPEQDDREGVKRSGDVCRGAAEARALQES